MGGGAVRTAELVRAGIDVNSPRMQKMRALADGDPILPAPSLPACRRLRHHPQPARRGGADRQRRDGRPHLRRMGQGRSRRARHPQGRRARARHADLPAQGVRAHREALWPSFRLGRSRRKDRLLRARDNSEGRTGRLPHAAARRLARRVPGREPRADVDAAAAQAGGILRSRHRGRDRAAGADPGRHGASLSAPPAGTRAGLLSLEGARSRSRARRSACRCSRSRR